MRRNQGYIVLAILVSATVLILLIASAFTYSRRLQQANAALQEELMRPPDHEP